MSQMLDRQQIAEVGINTEPALPPTFRPFRPYLVPLGELRVSVAIDKI